MVSKRVLVVDDSCMYQRILSDVIEAHPKLEVVGVAANGKIALDMVEALKPDLITLDILMPEMDGIQTLLQLCKKWPDVRTIMVSSLTSKGSDAALDALALGANEYVAKPTSGVGIGNIREKLGFELLPKIEALCGIDSNPSSDRVLKRTAAKHSMQPRVTGTAGIQVKPEIVVIGVSTGGPDALAKILPQLPANFDVPVCIVQHMPPQFTRKLANRLDSACALKIREAQLGDKLRAGTVYIAPGDFHMVLDRIGADVIVNLNQNPEENSCRPAVDPLFRSAAALFGTQCLGVILTGMGQDGLKGSEALFTAGASILVQDEASSIVWGMPKLVASAGLADQQVPLVDMADVITQRVRLSRISSRNNTIDSAKKAVNKAANSDFVRHGTAQGRSS